MSDETSKVTTYDTMPGRLITGVKLLLEKLSHIAFELKAIESGQSEFNGFALHIIGHIGGFDNNSWLTGLWDVTIAAISGLLRALRVGCHSHSCCIFFFVAAVGVSRAQCNCNFLQRSRQSTGVENWELKPTCGVGGEVMAMFV